MLTKKTKTKAEAAQTEVNTLPKTKHLGHEYNPAETNWAALQFPADPMGVTAKLRREFRDAVKRCRGSDEKFRHLADNLEILFAYAKAKLEADRIENAHKMEMAIARTEQDRKAAEFRQRIQSGPEIKVTANATGFVEVSRRDGSILAAYETADDEKGPVKAMAQMMIAEGRAGTSVLLIDAFGRPGVGSGQTLAELAGVPTGAPTEVDPASGGLTGIKA